MSKFSLNFLRKTTNRFNDFIQNLFSKYESSIFSKINYKFLKTNFLQENKRDKTIFGIVFIIFSILGYLSLPIIFDDTLMKNKIKYEVKNYFNLDFENYDDLEYRILPTPHFLLKEKKLLFEANDIAIVGKAKFKVSLNFLAHKNFNVREIVLDKARFNLNEKELKFFDDILDFNLLESVIKIKNSNIFFENDTEEVLFINQIKNLKIFNDKFTFENVLVSENEIFNTPVSVEIKNNTMTKVITSEIDFSKLSLSFFNELNYKTELREGQLDLNTHISKINFEYELFEENLKFFSNAIRSKDNIFSGNIKFKPFTSNFDINLNFEDFLKSLDDESIFLELINSGLLNNENLNSDINIKIKNFGVFSKIKELNIVAGIDRGSINLNDTVYNWNDAFDLKLTDSNLFIDESSIFLNGKLDFNFSDTNKVYSNIQTPKNFRKEINNLTLNFKFDLINKIAEFDNLIVNKKEIPQLNEILENYNNNAIKLNSAISFKKFINDMLSYYSG